MCSIARTAFDRRDHLLPQLMPPAEAGLVSREPVKNARSLLRNALPINDRYIREIQVPTSGQESALPRQHTCCSSILTHCMTFVSMSTLLWPACARSYARVVMGPWHSCPAEPAGGHQRVAEDPRQQVPGTHPVGARIFPFGSGVLCFGAQHAAQYSQSRKGSAFPCFMYVIDAWGSGCTDQSRIRSKNRRSALWSQV